MELKLFIVLALLVGLGSGCTKEIGDSCSTNMDCDPLGERICDTSQLDGYCTIQGCDLNTCPEEAVCVRFFNTSFLSRPCDPETEDATDPAILDVAGPCPAGKKCVTNDCSASEICLSSGVCAQWTLEGRFCMVKCEDDGDCRPDYECRKTGTRGAEAVRNPDLPGIQQVLFCAPKI